MLLKNEKELIIKNSFSLPFNNEETSAGFAVCSDEQFVYEHL